MATFKKDPNAILDFKFDWKAETNMSGDSDWLDDSETIVDFTITEEAGIKADSSVLSDNDTSVMVWLSGGLVGATYSVACEVVTNAGRTDKRTVSVHIEER